MHNHYSNLSNFGGIMIKLCSKPKISIIIPICGDHRIPYLHTVLDYVHKQNYTDVEIIVVEQINCTLGNMHIAGPYVTKDSRITKYQVIESKNHPVFNQPWMSNVGAKLSIGSKLLFMDSDIIIPPGYLQRISTTLFSFAFGFENIKFISRKDSKKILHGDQIELTYANLDHIYSSGIVVGQHPGHLVCVDRNFFINTVGYYSENYFGWGGNDNDLARRALHILNNPKYARHTTRIPSDVFHLWHERGYAKSSPEVKALYYKTHYNPAEVTKRLLQKKLGNVKHPTFISMDNL